MKFDFEKFTEKALDCGMADEFVSVRQKNEKKMIMEKLVELTEKLIAELTEEQRKLYEKIADLEIENESIVER